MARKKQHFFAGTSASYKALFGAENDDIDLENGYFLNVNAE